MKLPVGKRLRALAVGFPRRTRRGLIEAGSRPRSSARWEGDFPGGHAGASLKQRIEGILVIVLDPISPADTPGPH